MNKMSCGEESFLRMISMTAQVVRSYADQRLKKYDLTVEQLQVMKHMSIERGQTQIELSSTIGKSPANVTRILDRLEVKGRIARQSNPEDRRTTLVFLTEKGKVLKDEVLCLFDALGTELVADIAPEKQRIAFEVLGLIKGKIEKSSVIEGEGEQ